VERLSRYQWVWWGWRCWRRPFVRRFTTELRLIYRWSIGVGPCDLRRWIDASMSCLLSLH